MTHRVLEVVGSSQEAAAAARRLREDGAEVRQVPDLPGTPWDMSASRLVVVAEADERQPAVVAEALLRGVGVVAVIDESARDSSVAQDLRDAGATAPPAPLPLTEEQLEVLRRLAAGATVPEVASEMYLSVRTTERRIAAARRALGVRSTAAAVLAVAGSGGI